MQFGIGGRIGDRLVKADEGIGAEDWVGLRIEDLGLRGRLL